MSNEGEITYDTVFDTFAAKPRHRTLFRLCANSLVVVQEFSLSCYFLARHRRAVLPESDERHLNSSNLAILSALFLAIYYGTKSDPTKQQDRRIKARQRAFDSLLLAVLLRFLASLLRTLTASYSSDTVQSLALAGMALHVAACDYTYADGIGRDTTLLQQRQRPPFSGGTVALNAALFSTTLLISRLSSNGGAYLFSTLAVVLFAFYSGTRHAVAATYPPSCNGAYL